MKPYWRSMLERARGLIRLLLLIVVPLVAVLIGLYVYARGGREMETENAYVKANVMAVRARKCPGASLKWRFATISR